jgi:hypothetical protein
MPGTVRVWMAAAIGVCATLVCAAPPALGGAAGRAYVVDAGNPQAGDDNPGTEEKPWKTIAHAAARVAPGDTVYVMEGNYPERVSLSVSGAKDRPVSFVAVPTRRVLMYGFDANGASHVRIRGFEITYTKPAYGKESDYEGGIRVRGDDVEATDNFIHDLVCGISGGGERVRLAYNRLYKCHKHLLISGEDCVVEDNELCRVFKYFESDCDYCRGWGRNLVLRRNRLHGTRRGGAPGEEDEVKGAHLDCFQSWANKPGHRLQDFTFEENMCEVFSQGSMLEGHKAPDPNAMSRIVFRKNIFWKGGAWGLDLKSIKDVTVEDNTFARAGNTVIGFRPGTTGVSKGNICISNKDKGYVEDPSGKRTDIRDVTSVFTDLEKGNFRLRKDGGLVGTGAGAATPGALEYPNVYRVDGRHPAASDDGFGYPGWPYRTIGAALKAAQPGETVVIRGGVYRETLKPACDNVTIRAAAGEKVLVSGADLIEGWKRTKDGWAAPLAAEPKKVLRDGQPWTEFAYDAASKTIAVKTGGDPRMHIFETIVRTNGVDLTGRKDVKTEGVDVASTLGEPTVGAK